MKKFKRYSILLLIGLLSLALIACGGKDKDKKDSEDTKDAIVEKVEYFIRRVDEDKDSEGNTLYAYNVLVNEEANKASLKEISLEIADKAERETPFDFLSIRFYDAPQYIDSNSNVYNLGFVDVSYKDAIKGNPKDDGKEEEGKSMDKQFSFHIKEKDWEKKISKDEIDIVNRLYELMDKEDISSIGPAAEEVADMFSKEYDEIIQTLGNQLAWQMNNLDSSYDIHDPKYDVFDRKNKAPEKKEEKPKEEEEKKKEE